MQHKQDQHELHRPYCAALQRMGLTEAPSPSEASMLVQVMARSGDLCAEEALAPLSNQILLKLGWEEDYHHRSTDSLANSRIVYGRLPWTRNRLISTLLQAQKLAHRNAEEERPFTPVKELRALNFSDSDKSSEVHQIFLRLDYTNVLH